MLVWNMKLSDPWFDLVKSGKKKVEIRLYDEKRRKLNIGDKILFNDDFKKKIKDLKVFNTFEDALRSSKLKNSLPGVRTYKEGIDIYHSIGDYKKGEKKYKVLAIYL